MKVVHISTHDNKGGAAIAAYRLHKAFLKYGIKSKMIVKIKNARDDDSVVKMEDSVKLTDRIKNSIGISRKRETPNSQYGQYSDLEGKFKPSEKKEVQEADIIYLHWINGSYISIEEIENILKMGKPVYWMMHDMFPITGGCHYSMSCEKYHDMCNTCPFFCDDSRRAYRQLQSKIALRKFDNLEYVVTSKWLEMIATKSAVAKGKTIYRIPNCLNVDRFKPVDRSAARKLFNISNRKKVILFGAQAALYNYYKGFSFLCEALELLSKRQIQTEEINVLIFGSEYNEEIVKRIPFKIHFLGHLFDEFSLVMAYNCADILVVPSLAEAFGQTVIESMACNTPVVGFNVGGIPDNISDDTGYLAEYCSSLDLERGIYTMLYEKSACGMIEHVKRNNAEDVVVKRHIEMWADKNEGAY